MPSTDAAAVWNAALDVVAERLSELDWSRPQRHREPDYYAPAPPSWRRVLDALDELRQRT